MEQLSTSVFFFFFYVCISINFPLAALSGQTIMPLMGSSLFMNLLCLYSLLFFFLYEAINYIRISFLTSAFRSPKFWSRRYLPRTVFTKTSKLYYNMGGGGGGGERVALERNFLGGVGSKGPKISALANFWLIFLSHIRPHDKAKFLS